MARNATVVCVLWANGNLSSSGKPGVRVFSMLSAAFAELFSVCVCVCVLQRSRQSVLRRPDRCC